jgi:hypothetical protein
MEMSQQTPENYQRLALLRTGLSKTTNESAHGTLILERCTRVQIEEYR